MNWDLLWEFKLSCQYPLALLFVKCTLLIKLLGLSTGKTNKQNHKHSEVSAVCKHVFVVFFTLHSARGALVS